MTMMLQNTAAMMMAIVAVAHYGQEVLAFQPQVARMAINNDNNNNHINTNNNNHRIIIPSQPASPRRRSSMITMAGGFLSGLFGDSANSSNGGIVSPAYAASSSTTTTNTKKNVNSNKGPTNEVVKSINGMKLKRLGGSDIIVSELGLGTQRW